MSLKKTIVAVAAVGAVTAATAVPAMALENEFHGMFRVRGIVSNFDDSGAGSVAIGKQPGSSLIDGRAYNNPPTYNYIEQRARLLYSAKANDDLKLVAQFEFDSRWGDNSYNSNGSTRNSGGGIGADQTNLETKNMYLEFRIPSTPVRVKAGIQGFTDNYKGIIFNNDAAGLTAAAKVGNATIQGAYFRFDDGTTGNTYLGVTNAAPTNTITNATVGFMTRDFYTLGAKYAFNKNLVVGADYYLLYSDMLRHTQDKTYIHMIGGNAEAKVGPATINGFFIYQTGQLGNTFLNSHQDVSAFAGNLAARMPVGPGTAKITALVLSGDNDTRLSGGTRSDFQTVMERSAATSGHTFYESGSMLLLRNIQATDKTDRALVFDLNNNGRGIVTAFAGYDLPLGKMFWNTNVGFGCAESNNVNGNNGGIGNTTGRPGLFAGKLLGTEVNTEVGYKLYDNMSASLQGAYMFLGDFYQTAGGRPDNPYTTRVVLNYAF
jgi:hypothetical protein